MNTWIADSLPHALLAKVKHFALRGKLDLNNVGWWVKLILIIDAWKNDDPESKEHELHGFDFMDRAGIDPVLALVKQYISGQE